MMSTKKAQSIVISAALVFLLTDCGDTSAVRLAKEKEITDLLFCCSAFSATGYNQYNPEQIM